MVERKHWCIVETRRCLLHQSSLPQKFWVEVFKTVVFTIYRLRHITQNISPYELLFVKAPNYKILQVFRCLCYPLFFNQRLSKLKNNSTPCIFLGYLENHKAYQCYDESSKKVIISRQVKFKKDIFPFIQEDDSINPFTIDQRLRQIQRSSLWAKLSHRAWYKKLATI